MVLQQRRNNNDFCGFDNMKFNKRNILKVGRLLKKKPEIIAGIIKKTNKEKEKIKWRAKPTTEVIINKTYGKFFEEAKIEAKKVQKFETKPSDAKYWKKLLKKQKWKSEFEKGIEEWIQELIPHIESDSVTFEDSKIAGEIFWVWVIESQTQLGEAALNDILKLKGSE